MKKEEGGRREANRAPSWFEIIGSSLDSSNILVKVGMKWCVFFLPERLYGGQDSH